MCVYVGSLFCYFCRHVHIYANETTSHVNTLFLLLNLSYFFRFQIVVVFSSIKYFTFSYSVGIVITFSIIHIM